MGKVKKLDPVGNRCAGGLNFSATIPLIIHVQRVMSRFLSAYSEQKYFTIVWYLTEISYYRSTFNKPQLFLFFFGSFIFWVINKLVTISQFWIKISYYQLIFDENQLLLADLKINLVTVSQIWSELKLLIISLVFNTNKLLIFSWVQ